MPTPIDILKQYYGYEVFRNPQFEIIQSVLNGNDTLAMLPTGGGKSVCFQIPALLQDGMCIVVSPLIALMKDQVVQLKQRDIKAAAIFTGLSYAEIDMILDNAQFGMYKFLYVSPERLKTDIFIERFKNMKINLIAVDEAHCISQWGYDFRPPYIEIAAIRKYHPSVPVMALTASATERVQKEIIQKLAFKDGFQVFKKSFLRENLSFVVRNEDAKLPKVLEIIQKVKGNGMVYVRSRNKAKETAEYLYKHHINADFYHAGLNTSTRNKKQDAWIKNEISVMVCTNAFGMGIDKSDVRFVIHLDIPESLEAYYQEAGRAGRDGKLAYAVLLYNQQDIDDLLGKIEAQFPSIETIKRIYNAIGNHYAVPVENGSMRTFDFDLIHFCKLFKISVSETYHALKLLEQHGYFQLNEGILMPSRIIFKVDKLALYKFEVANESFAPLIKTILRTYGGILDHYSKISEQQLAKQLSISSTEVVKQLNHLQRQKILTYIPANDAPTITYLKERLHDTNLFIDVNYIQQQKDRISTQIKMVSKYASQQQNCRQVQICKYFGEENLVQCNRCDICLEAHQSIQIDEDFILVKRTFLEKLDNIQWKSMYDIFPNAAHFDKHLHKEVIRFLLDEKRIELNDKNEFRKLN